MYVSQTAKKIHKWNDTDILPESKGMDIMRWLLQLCAFGKCAISEKYPVGGKKNRIAFCSTCVTEREQARNLALALQGHRDEGQKGKKLLIHIQPRKERPCTDCIVCTQCSDVRICPQSTGMYARKCKAAASITHGDVQKVRSKREWKTNHFTLQLFFIFIWAKLERWVSLQDNNLPG